MSTKTANSAKRAPYGFALTFPSTPFTMRDLRKQKSHKVKYITLYMRVKKALADGDIVKAGEKAPATTRRGRKELVYTVAVKATKAPAVAVEASTGAKF